MTAPDKSKIGVDADPEVPSSGVGKKQMTVEELHKYESEQGHLAEYRIRMQEESELCVADPFRASPGSNFERYEVPVNHEEGDRATAIHLRSFARPHMRALHCAWVSFFLAFTIWFSPAPLLREIKETLNLSKREVWSSSITNDVTAIIMRVVIGPVCDKYGARIPMAVILILASIPAAMVGLVNSAAGLIIIRFFIGIAGSSFVMAQFWPSRMFCREIGGTANGIVGGWGNLGAAFTQLTMGRILFPLFRNIYDGDSSKSWRTICVIPAVLAFSWGCILPFISDDAPMGNYADMKKSGAMDRIYMTTSLRNGATFNTWILYIQYACSFGVEIAMNNGAVLYFTEEFDLSTEEASVFGFIYGSMNIFARALGGLFSDRLNLKFGMRGRLWLITILLLLEGATILIFAYTDSLGRAVAVMCIFSVFTQAAEGAIYGVVPYVSKLYTGAVAGFVGSGGNMGSVVYGFGFRSLPYRDAFVMMGSIVIASSFLSFLVRIPCHAGLIFGEDNHAVIQARERFLERKRQEQIALLTHPATGTVATEGANGGGLSEVEGPSERNRDDSVEDQQEKRAAAAVPRASGPSVPLQVIDNAPSKLTESNPTPQPAQVSRATAETGRLPRNDSQPASLPTPAMVLQDAPSEASSLDKLDDGESLASPARKDEFKNEYDS